MINYSPLHQLLAEKQSLSEDSAKLRAEVQKLKEALQLVISVSRNAMGEPDDVVARSDPFPNPSSSQLSLLPSHLQRPRPLLEPEPPLRSDSHPVFRAPAAQLSVRVNSSPIASRRIVPAASPRVIRAADPAPVRPLPPSPVNNVAPAPAPAPPRAHEERAVVLHPAPRPQPFWEEFWALFFKLVKIGVFGSLLVGGITYVLTNLI